MQTRRRVAAVAAMAVVLAVVPATGARAAWSPENPDWEMLDDQEVSSAPTVSSWGADRLDVFTTYGGKRLHKWWNGSNWSPSYENLDANRTDGILVWAGSAAVSWGVPREIDSFERSYRMHDLYLREYRRFWRDPEILMSGGLYSDPAASSWHPGMADDLGRVDVFGINSAGNLIHIWRSPTDGWHKAWENLGGISYAESSDWRAAPAAVSWDTRRIDVFIRGADSALHHKWWNGSTWSDWEQLGADNTLYSAPAVASWAPGRLDVFGTDSHGHIIHKYFKDHAWSGWQPLYGVSSGYYPTFDAPAAVSWGPDRIDVFVHGTDNRLYHRWWS